MSDTREGQGIERSGVSGGSEGKQESPPGTLRAVAMLALPAVVLTVLIFAYVIMHGGAVDETELRGVLPLLIAVSHATVLGALLWTLHRERRRLADIGWRLSLGQSLWREVLIGLALALALYLMKELVFDSVRAMLAGNRPTFTSLFRFRWNADEVPLLAVATTFILVEESVYRGYGLAPLVERLGSVGGLLVMSVFFGLLHWGNGGLAVVFTGIIGLIYGALFLWRRTLPAVIVAHAAYNAIVILT